MNGQVTFHYAYLTEAMDYVLCGWVPRPHILAGTPFAGRSVMMEWQCTECAVRKPKRGGPTE